MKSKYVKTFENFNNTSEYIITDIIYDIDDENDVNTDDLPQTLTIHVPNYIGDDYEIDEYISDEISNITGFTHKGYSVTPELNY